MDAKAGTPSELIEGGQENGAQACPCPCPSFPSHHPPDTLLFRVYPGSCASAPVPVPPLIRKQPILAQALPDN